MDLLLEIIPWLAVVLLSLGYWSQVLKIHKHKEVRDLSLKSYAFLATGFMVMSLRAWADGSVIFLVKQIATFIPVAIIIYQIRIHKDDHWHDENDEHCSSCGFELEPHWNNCTYDHLLRAAAAESNGQLTSQWGGYWSS